MYTILGLAMIASQIIAIAKSFGGLKDTPKWLDISVGIGLSFMMISMVALSME